MLIGGSFRAFDTNACAGLVRLGPDGRRDPSFAPPGDGVCNALALQTNGQILIGGQFSTLGGVTRHQVARFDPSGDIDAGFAPSFAPDDSVWALAVQGDGRILVGGYLSGIGDTPIHGLTRLLPGGERDPEFDVGDGTDGWVAALALLPDGRILVGGDFERFGGVERAGLVRLWPDGRVDEGLEAALTGSFLRIESIVVQADGGVLLGGRFESVQGTIRRGIARLDPSGMLDSGFAAAGGLGESYDEVRCIVPAVAGRLWVAGSFHQINGCQANHLVLLGGDGQPDPEFHPCGGVSGGLGRIVVQADGNLLLVGDFSYVNHVKRYGVARLIGQPAPEPEGVTLAMHAPGGSPSVRFDTNPDRRYTVEASADLTEWGAWVSGQFTARSVDLPVPVVFMGERQFFRATASLQPANRSVQQ